MVEMNLGCRTNLLVRGGGGLTVKRIREIVEQDSGYLGGDDQALNIAVLQFGIVDCAPRPITYVLSPFLRSLPVVGPKILASLIKHRRGLQNLCSYNATSKGRFKKEYAAIIYICNSVHIRTLAVGMPIPPFSIEHRSPGFRRSAAIYNELIRDVIPESFCDIEQHMTESLREFLLLSDGHHLTEEGHRFYAETLFERVKRLL